MPDGKQGALVVFNTKQGNEWIRKIQFLPMVEGIIAEMAKAGVKAYAVSVYENDEVNIWNDDDGQHVIHKPKVFGDRGARVGAFAAGKAEDGRTYVEAMNLEELAKIKARSKSKDKQGNVFGPWATDEERMEQKTVLHRLRKRIPILIEQGWDDAEDTDTDVGEPYVAPQPTGEPRQAATRPRSLQAVVDMPPPAEPVVETVTEYDHAPAEFEDGEVL
jgi:recombination protein RecT